MSIDIPLRFEAHDDPELLSEGITFNLIRLIADVQVKTFDGWSDKYQAIVDTGSPANLMPRFIWSGAENRFLRTKKISLSGVGSGKISGHLGEVTIRISYHGKFSKPVKLRAFLLETDLAPFILGFEDFLSVGKLLSNYPKNLASLQF
jgi:hypothetical protein